MITNPLELVDYEVIYFDGTDIVPLEFIEAIDGETPEDLFDEDFEEEF